MTAVNAPVDLPRMIAPHRWAANGDVPQGSLYGKLTTAQNHVVRWRRKEVFSYGGIRVDNGAAPIFLTGGGAGPVVRWRGHCLTGYGARRLVFLTHLALDDKAGATDCKIRWSITPTGGAEVFTGYASYGANDSATVTDTPSEIGQTKLSYDISPNTSYELKLLTYNDARPVGCVVFEESLAPDDGTDYYTKTGHAAGSPILDLHRQELLPAGTALWKRNAAPIFSWCVDQTAQARTLSSYLNVIDQVTTTNTSASAGYTLTSAFAYRTTYSRSVVPALFAVYASAAAGTAGKCKLLNAGGDIAAITNIGAAGWYTSKIDLSAAAQKIDIQWAGDGANACSISAVSLYQYED
jgi:hypothetical protein